MIEFDKSKCSQCKACKRVCPALAIEPEKNRIEDSCILCGQCIAVCKSDALFMNTKTSSKLKNHTILDNDFKAFAEGIRSVRNYKDTEVPMEVLTELLSRTSFFPSASNARPVEITAVTNVQKREYIEKEVQQTLYGSFKKYSSRLMAPITNIAMGSGSAERLKSYAANFDKKMVERPNFITYNAPVILLFHAPQSKLSLAKADAHIWSAHLSIHAAAMGLGTCINGFIVTAIKQQKNIKDELGIPEDHEVHTSLLLGYPSVQYTNRVNRTEAKVHHII